MIRDKTHMEFAQVLLTRKSHIQFCEELYAAGLDKIIAQRNRLSWMHFLKEEEVNLGGPMSGRCLFGWRRPLLWGKGIH